MSNHKEIQKTMNTVMEAHQVVNRFHCNVADLFRSVSAELESMDPAYGPSMEEGELLMSSISNLLRSPDSWMIKHLALSLCDLEEESSPIFLVHISTDKQFHDSPEVWLGILSNIESFQGENAPWPDTVSYIFRDYFGPEDSWTEEGSWYDVDFEDELVSANMSFCRIPLSKIVDRDAIREEICERLHVQLEELLETDEE